MTKQLQERINILQTLNVRPFNNSNAHSGKWLSNKILLLILGICYAFNTILVLLYISNDFFSLGKFHWENSAANVLWSLISLILIRYGLLFIYAIHHREQISNERYHLQDDIQQENRKLKLLVKSVNNRLQRSWFTIAIIVIAMVQTIFKHRFPFWNYLELPFLICMIYETFDYISLKRKFQTNFDSVMNKIEQI